MRMRLNTCVSLLSDFVGTAAPLATAIIGTQTIAIGGGGEVAIVPGEIRAGRSYETGGFEKEEAMDVVARTSAFVAVYSADPNTYLGKTAVVNSRAWRVDEIRRGEFMTTISLVATATTA